jgi:hypothetical protein
VLLEFIQDFSAYVLSDIQSNFPSGSGSNIEIIPQQHTISSNLFSPDISFTVEWRIAGINLSDQVRGFDKTSSLSAYTTWAAKYTSKWYNQITSKSVLRQEEIPPFGIPEHVGETGDLEPAPIITFDFEAKANASRTPTAPRQPKPRTPGIGTQGNAPLFDYTFFQQSIRHTRISGVKMLPGWTRSIITQTHGERRLVHIGGTARKVNDLPTVPAIPYPILTAEPGEESWGEGTPTYAVILSQSITTEPLSPANEYGLSWAYTLELVTKDGFGTDISARYPYHPQVNTSDWSGSGSGVYKEITVNN